METQHIGSEAPFKKQNIFAVIAALIWGTAFVAQSVSTDLIEPFTFNAVRFLIGALSILPVILLRERKEPKERREHHGSFKDLAAGGFATGTLLAIAANLQQIGIAESSAGKAGFLTALYIIIVPILGVFLKKKVPFTVWISVVVAAFGMFFLCVKDEFKIEKNDAFLLTCALIYALQIIEIDKYVGKVSGMRLSCAQFVVAFMWSGLFMVLFEHPTFKALKDCAFPILYVGILSSGVAYTLQIMAQKDSNPTIISLLLSLESVFSVVSGAILLNERMTGREYLGCALMMAAVVLVQVPIRPRRRKAKAEEQET